MHAREVHANEMHAHKVLAHKTHAYKVYPYEIHTREMHACEIPAHGMHIREIYTHEYIAENGRLSTTTRPRAPGRFNHYFMLPHCEVVSVSKSMENGAIYAWPAKAARLNHILPYLE
jgi:hypothetical protein